MDTGPLFKTEYLKYSDTPAALNGTVTIKIPKGTRFVRVDPALDVYFEIAINAVPATPTTGSPRVLANVPQDIQINDQEHCQIALTSSASTTFRMTFIQ
jgi:hypothetical protein